MNKKTIFPYYKVLFKGTCTVILNILWCYSIYQVCDSYFGDYYADSLVKYALVEYVSLRYFGKFMKMPNLTYDNIESVLYTDDDDASITLEQCLENCWKNTVCECVSYNEDYNNANNEDDDGWRNRKCYYGSKNFEQNVKQSQHSTLYLKNYMRDTYLQLQEDVVYNLTTPDCPDCVLVPRNCSVSEYKMIQKDNYLDMDNYYYHPSHYNNETTEEQCCETGQRWKLLVLIGYLTVYQIVVIILSEKTLQTDTRIIDGWEKKFDDNSKHYYWYHSQSKQSKWTNPNNLNTLCVEGRFNINHFKRFLQYPPFLFIFKYMTITVMNMFFIKEEEYVLKNIVYFFNFDLFFKIFLVIVMMHMCICSKDENGERTISTGCDAGEKEKHSIAGLSPVAILIMVITINSLYMIKYYRDIRWFEFNFEYSPQFFITLNILTWFIIDIYDLCQYYLFSNKKPVSAAKNDMELNTISCN